ncbi:putative PGG domain-containing protein [Rosa chinensis]|uniref:Putative PGG domain-containing protein n=1 Tax=Rosa chinensis TaxID=74649 RepID=A0A2P6Q0W5_ROSCH|nr:putative PGG domain-containing protein [Rosa chinensis]
MNPGHDVLMNSDVLFRGTVDKTRQYEIYREALQNTRTTITIVAVLTDSVTYTAGINPPCGVYQEGWLKGQSIYSWQNNSFKVFTISNTAALFISMCIVIVLVSIIPFRRKSLMIDTTCGCSQSLVASWIFMPHGRGEGENWTLEVVTSVCAGTMGSVFLFLGVTWTRHLMKMKWRKQIRKD